MKIVVSVAVLALASTVSAAGECVPLAVINAVVAKDIRIYDEQFNEIDELSEGEFRDSFFDPLSIDLANGAPFSGEGVPVWEINEGLLLYKVSSHGCADEAGEEPQGIEQEFVWLEGVAFEVFTGDAPSGDEVCPGPILANDKKDEAQKDITTGFGGCVAD
jgi:hypothetical protein